MRIMGISPFHDSSVAVINNGEIECFYKEERYTRIKRDFMPWVAFEKARKFSDEPFDCAIISSPYGEDVWLPAIKIFVEKTLGCKVFMYCDKHHISHASLAFYNSGFEKSLVFVIDRNGSVDGNRREAESVYSVAYPDKWRELYKNYWNNASTGNMSIVKVYETATTLINEHQLENGKTMGLSSYGEDKAFVQFFKDGKPDDSLFTHKSGKPLQEPTIFTQYLGKESNVTPENYKFYADYCYQVQKQTQEQVLNLVKTWVNKTGIKNVCLTGGYGLNVVANSYLVDNLPECNFYFEPLADDSGNSIGAAMHWYRLNSGDSTS